MGSMYSAHNVMAQLFSIKMRTSPSLICTDASTHLEYIETVVVTQLIIFIWKTALVQ